MEYVQRYGNQLVIFLDGSEKKIALPTSNADFWVISVSSVTPSGDFKWPFDKEDWTTYYKHSGLDWPYASGTDIPIIGPGTIQEVYNNSSNTWPGDSSEPVWRGNCIVVNHGIIGGVKITSLYAHMLNNPAWSVGDPVVGGDIAGQIGNSGFSNGAHLHFEIIYNDYRLTNSEGGGAQRAENWMNAHTDGSNW
jgi:murein DD-endopeptidase MepM/ murein hydrolase activator NlpD